MKRTLARAKRRKQVLLPGVLALMVAGVLLDLFLVFGYRQRVESRSGLTGQLMTLERQASLLQRFQQPYDTLRAGQHAISNTRIHWMQRLDSGLTASGPAKVNFMIEDPGTIQTDLVSLSGVATIKQYPVRIDATPENDIELLGLLQHLSAYSGALFENRGCHAQRQIADTTALRLQCLYVVYDIVLVGEDNS